jgi:hypothetical protein
MLSPLPFVLVVAVGLIVGSFYYWARRQGLLAAEPAATKEQGRPRVSLLTEAVAYVGAVLLLAGGIAAVGRRWDELGGWGRVGVLAGASVLLLTAGILVRGASEPAIQRLAGVMLFLSVACAGGAVGFGAHDVYGSTGAITVLAVGLGVTVYAALLWLVRRRAAQNAVLFAGLVIAICGTIATGAGGPGPVPALAYALPLWGFGLGWSWLGWRRYAEPIWVTMPCGAILALVAPGLAAGEHGWLYAIGIATAAAAMAASVPLRNTPLLALGTLAMFGYVTPAAIRYFHQFLGVPAALAVTGALILGLAVVSARLMRSMQA